jgi:phage anti-repressor protein
MDNHKAQEALLIARELAQKAKSATDLHNAFFGVAGKFAELFPTRAEREAFAQTPEYQEILRLRAALPQREKAAS